MILTGNHGRVSPAFEQWLAHQAMLTKAQDLTRSVTDTAILWKHSAATPDADRLLNAAPTWLAVDPLASPAFSARKKDALIAAAKTAGISGIWLSAVNEDDTLWSEGRPLPSSTGATTSLSPDHRIGSEKDLDRFIAAIEHAGLQPGMPLVPAATGLGPDFMLQARGSAMFRGLYVQIAVPAEHWDMLPKTQEAWDIKSLSERAQEQLTASGVLPQIAQDGSGNAGFGWAVTGPVLGVDGNTRRLAYRYAGSPARPVLFWQDPTGLARTLLAGSAIQTTGLRRQPLAGVSLKGWAGLDAPDTKAPGTVQGLSPAMEALSDITAQVHRYGGWSLMTDGLALPLPDRSLPRADFSADQELASLLDGAAAGGDATGPARHLDALLAAGTDFRRLAHMVPGTGKARTADGEALQTTLALGLPGLAILPEELAWDTPGMKAAPLMELGDLVRARAQLGVARGRLVRVMTPSPGVLACIVSLPAGGHLVTAVNFAAAKRTAAIVIPDTYGIKSLKTLSRTGAGSAGLHGQTLTLSLNARQALSVLAGR